MRMVHPAYVGAAVAVALAAPAMAQNVPQEDVVTLASFDTSQLKNGFTVDRMMDSQVFGRDGGEIGTVQNIVIGQDDRASEVIVEVGGALEIGDKVISVPWDQVDVTPEQAGIKVMVDADNVESFSLFNDRETVATGPRAYKATELLGDYVRLKDGVNYGYVRDIAFTNDGRLHAVVVQPDVTYTGAGGYFAYPYYGYGYGFDPGLDTYDLPYDRDAVAGYEPFEYDDYYADAT